MLANIRIIEGIARELGLPEDRFFANIAEYGNTSAASVPIALWEAVEQGRISSGDTVMIGTFGGGMAWGIALLEW